MLAREVRRDSRALFGTQGKRRVKIVDGIGRPIHMRIERLVRYAELFPENRGSCD
jgi:hypothetical protein